VSDHEFLFALELSDEKTFDAMLTELTRTVLVHLGFATGAIDELSGALHRALAGGTATGRRPCHVRFLAQAGELQIAVTCDGGAEWRTTRRLS